MRGLCSIDSEYTQNRVQSQRPLKMTSGIPHYSAHCERLVPTNALTTLIYLFIYLFHLTWLPHVSAGRHPQGPHSQTP